MHTPVHSEAASGQFHFHEKAVHSRPIGHSAHRMARNNDAVQRAVILSRIEVNWSHANLPMRVTVNELMTFMNYFVNIKIY